MHGSAKARVAMVTAHYPICTSYPAILDIHTLTPPFQFPPPAFA